MYRDQTPSEANSPATHGTVPREVVEIPLLVRIDTLEHNVNAHVEAIEKRHSTDHADMQQSIIDIERRLRRIEQIIGMEPPTPTAINGRQ